MNRTDYIQVKDVSKAIGISQASVIKLIHAGKIPAIVVNASPKRQFYKIHKDDFAKFLVEARVVVERKE